MKPVPLDVIEAETAERTAQARATQTAFPAVIDSTMRSDAVSCKKRFYEAHMEHLRGVETNVHLHFGGVYAKGLEVLRRSYWSPTSPHHLNVQASFAAGAEAIIRAWGDYIPQVRTNKTLEGCLDAYMAFIETYPLETDPIIPFFLNGEPCVEFSFALPIPHIRHPETGGPILYAGRFDMLATMRHTSNSIYIDDEKTTTQLGDSWLNQWKLRGQLTGYKWGAEQYGYPIAGIVVRGSSILKWSIGQALVIEQRHDYMVDRWLRQLVRDVSQLIECYETGIWDYNFDTACSAYGGCGYLPICMSPDEEVWRKNYIVKPWDPLARGG